jgi:membrane protease YdiL (CAAX protease family)
MTANTFPQHAAEESLKRTRQAAQVEQYSLGQLLGIWAGAALPMGAIYWAVIPTLSPHLTVEPGFVFYALITLGLVWQGILAYIILRREVKPFTWENLKDRLWLYTPSNPKTGTHSKWLYLWTIPLIVFMNLPGLGFLNDLWIKTFPFLTPPYYAQIQNLADVGEGQWWLLGFAVVSLTFNYLLGEELIFRGILLPKMNGVFGKWDWIANHILFSAYHLHYFWTTPTRLLKNWVYAWSTKRFKSYWMGVIVHGSDAPFLIIMFVAVILGWIG